MTLESHYFGRHQFHLLIFCALSYANIFVVVTVRKFFEVLK